MAVVEGISGMVERDVEVSLGERVGGFSCIPAIGAWDGVTADSKSVVMVNRLTGEVCVVQPIGTNRENWKRFCGGED